MTTENFENLVNEGIGDIPQKFLDKIKNTAIVIEDEPTKEQLKKLKMRKDYFLFGLYEGVPKTERWGGEPLLPDKITIFKNEIEKYARSEEEIKRIVKETVWHEIAHHFGMDEEMVRSAEKRRKHV
ncbi:MAG: metallopeptidase family protein [Candidatus Pacebacteria bacterium]|nr:metallopeptidase family protein [Candidatus Paceibacterota bacterium]